MNEATLSVIVPTLGAATLSRTLDSIISQELIEGDQIIIVADGHNPEVETMVARYGFEYLASPIDRNWGNGCRNFAMKFATGSYISWMDDDDIYLPDAFKSIRFEITKHYGNPLMFKFYALGGALLWQTKEIALGRVGGHEAVFPNNSERLGYWSAEYCGDYHFIRSTIDLYPNKDADIIWCEQIIAKCRP